MIVRYSEEGWEVITQPAHGLLAFTIAMRWKPKVFPERWMELLLAIAGHDDAEVELDGENLLTPNGGPLNYEMKTFDPDHCKQLSQLSLTKSRYTALLTSIHMDFLYSKDAAAKKFLKAEEQNRKNIRSQLGITETEASQDYALLEWCDAMSLVLCRNDIQPEQRTLEISTGPDKERYFLSQAADKTLFLDPWPFDKKEFKVAIEYRVISQLTFRDSAEFRKAFYEAEVREKSWTFKKS